MRAQPKRRGIITPPHTLTPNATSCRPLATLSRRRSPFSPPTHWKQTTFLLPTATALVPGKCLNCNISFLQDETNPRLYNVNIETDEEEGTGDVEIEEADPDDCECAKCKLLRLLTAKADSDAQAAQVSGILFK